MVLHEGASVPMEVKLKRETIRVSSVKARWIEPATPGCAWPSSRRTPAAKCARTGAAARQAATRCTVSCSGPAQQSRWPADQRGGGQRRLPRQWHDRHHARPPEGRPRRHADLSGGALVVLGGQGHGLGGGDRRRRAQDNRRELVMGPEDLRQGLRADRPAVGRRPCRQAHRRRAISPQRVSIQAAGIVPDIALRDLRLTVRDSAPTFHQRTRSAQPPQGRPRGGRRSAQGRCGRGRGGRRRRPERSPACSRRWRCVRPRSPEKKLNKLCPAQRGGRGGASGETARFSPLAASRMATGPRFLHLFHLHCHVRRRVQHARVARIPRAGVLRRVDHQPFAARLEHQLADCGEAPHSSLLPTGGRGARSSALTAEEGDLC